MATEIGWELYRTFLGVLKHGSLSGAARALDLAQPTVGRHIAALEKSLGLALFTRSQTGLMPTEAAQSLRGLAESMQAQRLPWNAPQPARVRECAVRYA